MDLSFDDIVRASKRLSRVMIPLEGDDLKVKVAWIRVSATPAPQHIGDKYNPHSHSLFELHAIIEGWEEYAFEAGGRARAQAGEMILIAPGQKHLCTAEETTGRKYSVCFLLEERADGAKSGTDSAYLRHFLNSRPYYLLKQSPNFAGNLERIFAEMLEARPGYLTVLRTCVIQLIFDIARQIEDASQDGAFRVDAESARQHEPRVEAVRQFVRDRMSGTVCCAHVAAHLHMSVKQLDRVTRAECGMSLHRLIESIKHHCAREMLLETDMTIREVSDALGYSSEYNFNRFFKRVEGMSAGKFRHARYFYGSVWHRNI